MEKENQELMSESEQKNLEVSRRAALTTVAKLGLGSAAMVAALKAGQIDDALAASRSEDLPKKGYHFVFVNHVTTNAFFTPTQSGAADACKLLGCTYQWTGSATSSVAEMVKAMQTAIAGKADGIAVAIIDKVAFDAPTNAAFAAGIPVISYNADGSPTNKRLAYIGQDLFKSGVGMGQHIAALVGSGKVGLFIATPGSLNIQPRIDGARSVLAKTSGITLYPDIATGALIAQERQAVEAWWTGHQDVKGMFAVDQGTTQGIIQRRVLGIPLLDNQRMRRQTIEYLTTLGIRIPSVASTVALLSGGQRQSIAVARSIYSNPTVLIMDEPLAALGVREGKLVINLVQELKRRGDVSIIIIAHNYAQIFEVSDRINFLSGGRIVYDKRTKDTTVGELVELVTSGYKVAPEPATTA